MSLFFVLFLIGSNALLVLREQILVNRLGVLTPIPAFAVFSFLVLTLLFVLVRKLYVPATTTKIFLALLVWMSISTVFSQDLTASPFELLRYFALFALFITVFTLSKLYAHFSHYLITGLALVGSLLTTKDLIQYVAWGSLGTGGSLTGTFYWHNPLATYLILIIPITLGVFLSAKNHIYRFLTGSLVIIDLFAMILTYSRAGWLGAALSLAVFLWLSHSQIIPHLKPLIKVLLIVSFLGLFLANPRAIYERAQTVVSESSIQTRSTSGTSRTTSWTIAWRMFKDHPLVGIGPRAYGTVFFKYQYIPWFYSHYAHNFLLQEAAELGLPGLIIFIALFASLAIPVIKSLPKFTLLQKSVFCALIGSFFHSQLDFGWSFVSIFSLVWIYLAVLQAQSLDVKATLLDLSRKKIFYLIPMLLALFSVSVLITLKKKPSLIFDTLPKPKYDADDLFQKAYDAEQKNDYAGAESKYSQAIVLNPYRNPGYYINLANVYWAQGKTQSAQQTLEAAVNNIFPLNSTYHDFEWLYEASGDKQNLAALYINLLLIYNKTNQSTAAAELISVAKTNFPDYVK